MNESDARAALLVRAWETAPAGSVPWSDEDRAWASHGAARIEGEHASPEAFVAARARLALSRIVQREPAARHAANALRWRPWIAWALVTASFALGLASDLAGASRQINLLAPPLLALLSWNLAVYFAGAVRGLAGSAAAAPLGRLAAPLLARIPGSGIPARHRHAARNGSAEALSRFGGDWLRASARLNAARLARTLHLCAIAFALGALAVMYLRGLVFEYRAGWESTFLDAGKVHALLAFVLGPASAISGIALPDATALQAMRMPGPGAEAAPWIHLHALTVVLFVGLPRLALTAREFARERRLATRFPLSLDDPYFTALTRTHRGETSTLAIVPCNHRPSPDVRRSLATAAARLFGPLVQIEFAAATVYGEEEKAGAFSRPPEEAIAGAIALFPATATPETETHGVFLEALAKALPAGTPLVAVVDESAFVTRLGQEPDAAQRREARALAWRRMLSTQGQPVAIVDLERAEPAAIESELGQALARATHLSANHQR